jgi:hypothetical protein
LGFVQQLEVLMAIPEYMIHLTDLGGLVKRSAVTLGGKSILAEKAGVTVEEIEFITKGEGHRVDRATMLKVAGSCPGIYKILSDLIDKTHPDRSVGTSGIYHNRISTPLTNASRSPQHVGAK